MLTNLRIRNFKRFDDVEIPLTHPVVFIGPNNSGKTTALQALSLWQFGSARLRETLSTSGSPPFSVALNRLDLVAVPVPRAEHLWKDLIHSLSSSDQAAIPVPIEVQVSGETDGKNWSVALKFEFANAESITCTLIDPHPQDLLFHSQRQVSFLPALSGVQLNEVRLEPGAINVRLGEGRSGDVLRNLCYKAYSLDYDPFIGLDHSFGGLGWNWLKRTINELFQVELGDPRFNVERGEIDLKYREASGPWLDLVSSGRGFHQSLLLLALLSTTQSTTLLLDEPDAHLEILRQKQLLNVLRDACARTENQLIIASHSEAVMNSAVETDPDSVIAFLGKPRRVPRENRTHLRKWLIDTPFNEFYQAEQQGWLLYTEDLSDLAILRAFANRLNHAAASSLQRPFQVSIGNQPNKGRQHFAGLSFALPHLKGILIVDRDAKGLQDRSNLREHQWRRREIENYLCQPSALMSFAESLDLPDAPAKMDAILEDRVPAAALRDPNDIWWKNTKASDDYLDIVLDQFYKSFNRRNELPKSDYYRLVSFVPIEEVDPEIQEVLDLVAATAAPPPKPDAPTPA